MIGGDFVLWRGEEKKGVSVFSGDFNIGFITSANVIDIAFVM